jgi:aspartyl-tRNA(Asn)/glutamyl-tRNA(Gln) amidotransferase subunit C
MGPGEQFFLQKKAGLMLEQDAEIQVSEVARVAALARLSVGAEEAVKVAHDLGRILGYVKQLQQVSVEEVQATTHVSGIEGHLRPDVLVESMPVERALSNAPERLGDGFGVPKIIE